MTRDASPPPPAHDRAATGRRTFGVILGALLLAAILIRTLPASEGLPYLHRWGEPNIAGRSLDMLKTGDLNPHWFKYGSPTIYLHAGVDVLHYFWLCGQPGDGPASLRSPAEIRTQYDTKYQWTISHPSFFYWNRVVTGLIGAAVVALTYVLGRRLSGRWAALVATAVVAAAAAHVEVSTTIRTDMPGALLATLAVLASLAFARERRPGFLVVAFFAAGLAASTKYNLVISLIAPFLALAFAAFRRENATGHRPWLWAVAVVLPGLAFLLGTPFALFDLSTFLADAGSEVYHYKVAGHAARTIEPGLPHLLFQLGELRSTLLQVGPLSGALGALALALALPGLALLLARREGWILLAFPAVYALFMTRTTVNYHHNFVAAYPFLAIAIGSGAVWMHGVLRRVRPAASNAFALVLGLALATHVASALSTSARTGNTRETRSLAIDEVNEQATQRGWTKIAVAEELRMHATDLERLDVDYEELRLNDLLLRQAEFDALMTPAAFKARERSDDESKAKVDRLNRRRPKGEVYATIGTEPLFLTIRSIHPGVVVSAPVGSG